jgi:hypothetical protein
MVFVSTHVLTKVVGRTTVWTWVKVTEFVWVSVLVAVAVKS